MSKSSDRSSVLVVATADATPDGRAVVDALEASGEYPDSAVVDGVPEAREHVADEGTPPACLVVVTDDAETVAATVDIGADAGGVPVLAVSAADRTADAFEAGADDVHPQAAGLGGLPPRVDRLVDARTPRATGGDPAVALREKERRLEAIHRFAHDVGDCDSVDDVCRRTVEAAERILAFDICYVGLVEDGYVVPRASTNEEGPLALDAARVDGSVVGESLRSGRSYVHGDIAESDTAEPADDSFASGLTVPIGEMGAFQAVSYERDDFTEEDRELADLLLSHVGEALKRVRFESELREERDRLGALFENLPEPVAACHAEGGRAVVDDVNAAFERVFGYDRERVVGNDIDEFVLPDGEEGITLDETYYVGSTVQSEVQRRTETGVRDFLLTVIPLELGDFSAEGFVVYADVSGQKRREKELERQNDRLAEFTSLVSHDLRNPLNVAKGHLDLATADGEVDRDHLDTAANALDRMENLISDFLALARQGRTVDETVAVDLGDAARSAWRTVDTGDAASIVVDDDLPTVQADPERLRTVFENLFRNAVEHGDPGVEVTVGALPGGRGLFVADDGPGIPPENRERAFEYGFTTESEGTGFGLATVQRVVEAHGWSVAVEDREGGEGSRFAIRLR